MESSQKLEFFPKRPIFSHVCATCVGIEYNFNTFMYVRIGSLDCAKGHWKLREVENYRLLCSGCNLNMELDPSTLLHVVVGSQDPAW